MIIEKATYEKIINSYCEVPPENGGILGAKNGVVCKYFHDNSCKIDIRAEYKPDVEKLNKKIMEWCSLDIQFIGLAHSHILGQTSLSNSDINYINDIFSALPQYVSELFFPIIIPEKELIISYLAKRDGKNVSIQKDEIHIII